MIKFLIGPAIVGAGYAAGSYYGADAEQLVNKAPSTTYDAIDQALGTMRTSGTTYFDGGKPVPYEIKIDRRQGEKLVATLFFAGQVGAEADILFIPRNEGRATLIEATIHANRTVLRTVLAGTDRERLAYAPDWMLNLTFKPLLKQLASEIETGQNARLDDGSGQTEAQWEANLSGEERDELAHWRQQEATQPAVDPDAAARNYGGDTRD